MKNRKYRSVSAVFLQINRQFKKSVFGWEKTKKTTEKNDFRFSVHNPGCECFVMLVVLGILVMLDILVITGYTGYAGYTGSRTGYTGYNGYYVRTGCTGCACSAVLTDCTLLVLLTGNIPMMLVMLFCWPYCLCWLLWLCWLHLSTSCVVSYKNEGTYRSGEAGAVPAL